MKNQITHSKCTHNHEAVGIFAFLFLQCTYRSINHQELQENAYNKWAHRCLVKSIAWLVDCTNSTWNERRRRRRKKRCIFFIFKHSSGNEKNTRQLSCIPISNINYYWVQNNRRIKDGIQKQQVVHMRKIIYRLCVYLCCFLFFH